MEIVSADADIESADWTKQSWDLPPYRSAEFLALVHDLEAFKKLPVYKFAVDAGLIHDDEWMGDFCVPASIVKSTPVLTTQQIGKLGELLVQYKLLQHGIESAHLTTDAGIDLVAYSSKAKDAKTIQVKANLEPKPAGGKGSLALDWWFPQSSPADLIALADISTNRVWLFSYTDGSKLAQQTSSGRHHLYMYVDPESKAKVGKLSHAHKFDEYLLENCVHTHFF